MFFFSCVLPICLQIWLIGIHRKHITPLCLLQDAIKHYSHLNLKIIQLKHLLLLLLLWFSHTALEFCPSPRGLSEVDSPSLWWLTKAVASGTLMRYKRASQSENFWFQCFLKMWLCCDSGGLLQSVGGLT